MANNNKNNSQQNWQQKQNADFTQVKNDTKKSNPGILLLCMFLIVTIIVSSSVGLYAWARYTKAQSGNANAQVAKWSFKLTNGTEQVSETANLAITRTDGNSHVEEGELAPGTFGQIPIGIDATETETNLEYTVTVSFTNLPTNLKLYSSYDSTNQTYSNPLTINRSGTTATVQMSDYLTYTQAQAGEQDLTMYWNWPYETAGNNAAENAANDRLDTQDAGKTVTMQITATGTEVLGQSQAVTFNSNGGNGTMSSQRFAYGVPQALTTNAFTKEHYTFAGWNTEANGSGTSYTNGQSITITSATTLYAQWTGEQHTVTFNANNGTGTMDAQTFTYGTAQNLTANTFTNADTTKSFGSWNTAADGSGTRYTNSQSIDNLTEDITLYAQWLTSVGVTLNGETVNVNADNVGQYYGKAVTNYNQGGLTYRIFYIDTENKYGDGYGTVYLMADYSLTSKLNNYTNYSSSSDTKIEEMNPLWAVTRGNSSVDWNTNEKAAAYLCDTNQWTEYASDNANYAIGGASTEMFIDSYNQWGKGTYKLGYGYQTTNTPGYVYKVNGTMQYNGFGTDTGTLDSSSYTSDTGARKMYVNDNAGFWWLASPSAGGSNLVCGVGGSPRGLSSSLYRNTFGVRPLVCLNSGVNVTFAN